MRKLFFHALALVASLFLATSRLLAEDEPKQDPDFKDKPAAVSAADIEGLNNRLKALERSNVKVGALIQFWYSHDSYGASQAGTSNDYNSSKNQWDAFSFKRGEISIGSELEGDPKLSWLVKLDPAQASFNGSGSTAGTALSYAGSVPGAASGGNINPFTLVKDLYVKVVYSPYATVILGQNKFAQELEGRWASNDADFNNLSNLSNSFGNKRDMGVQLEGAGIPLADIPLKGEYVFSIIQGSGQSTADNNVNKDLAGRIGFNYENDLFIGASGYDGWEVNGARWDFGLEGRWSYRGLKIQSEFVTGNLNTNDNSASNDSSWTPSIPMVAETKKFLALSTVGQIDPTAYYLTASYRYKDLRLGARWDGYNFDQWAGSKLNQEFDTLTIGLDWYQNKDHYKLSLNWEDHLLDGVEAYQVTTIQSQFSI